MECKMRINVHPIESRASLFSTRFHRPCIIISNLQQQPRPTHPRAPSAPAVTGPVARQPDSANADMEQQLGVSHSILLIQTEKSAPTICTIKGNPSPSQKATMSFNFQSNMDIKFTGNFTAPGSLPAVPGAATIKQMTSGSTP